MNMSKNISKKAIKGKRDTKTGLIVLGIIIVIIILAIMLAANAAISAAPTRLVTIPAVETHILSDAGTPHMLGTRIVLEIDNSAGDVDQDQLYDEILAAVSGLSYEEIISFHGTDIIRNAVRDRVEGHLGQDELVAVFLTEIMTDMPMLNRDVDREPNRNLMFDAIFSPRD